jgi:dienelactone hydrolase
MNTTPASLKRFFQNNNPEYVSKLHLKFCGVNMKLHFSFIVLLLAAKASFAQLKITFPSKDDVTVTADWYPVNSESQTILLCHQNGFSRGEYRETAQKLNKLGFNCLAIDQRAGGEVNGVPDETARDAKEKKKELTPINAEQDIQAAVDWLFQKYNRRIILFGSSYSASLALKVAKENDHVFAVVAFSPGEYFESKDFVAKHVSGLKKPVFLTSSKQEAPAVTELSKDILSLVKLQYIPKGEGDHGSKVLWSSKPENQDYWAALMSFLNRMKKENE